MIPDFCRGPRRLLLAGAICAPALVNAHTDLTQFDQTVFTQMPALIDFALDDGTTAQCYEFKVNYLPKGLANRALLPCDDG